MQKEEYRVSVIVPVYKVEQYLARCLDSLLAQTYRELEVILVDDGSPDGCGEICEAYARRDPRFRVLHQENQGQAAARNNAAAEAAGEFIVFVDSDDFVVPDYIEYLVWLQRQDNADMAVARGIYYFEHTEPKVYPDDRSAVLLTPEEALIRMNYNQGMGAMPWAKIFRRELVLRHPFPAGRIYEDLATMYRLICDSERIAYGKRRIYYWSQREGSTMHMRFDERQYAALTATEEMLEFVSAEVPGALASAKARHETKIIELMGLAMKSEDRRESYRRLKARSRFYREVMGDGNVRLSQKLRMAGMRMGYLPARLVFAVHDKLKERVL